MNRCECGKVMAKWRDKCKACQEAELAEWNRLEQLFIDNVNRALQNGSVVHTTVLGRPVTIKRLYDGVPGTWFIDNEGGHWCLSSGRRDIEDQLGIAR